MHVAIVAAHNEYSKPDGTRETLYLWIGYTVNNYEIQLHSSWIIEIVSHSFHSVHWTNGSTKIFYSVVAICILPLSDVL